jgi:hypothetical protein
MWKNKKNKDICPRVPFGTLYNLTPFDIQNERKVKAEIPQLGSVIATVRKGTTNFVECSHPTKSRQLQMGTSEL